METKSVSPVFVGRTAELAALEGTLERARTGAPQAVLIGGEAGVGKTRLVEEFAAACGEDVVLAVGGCVETGAEGLPFAPFSTALRTLRRLLPQETADAARGQEGELSRLLPELGESPRAGYDEEGMARLFELTARLLERIASERAVVIVLEDLHWADASTRHLLSYLFRTLRSGRLVVVATYRADDVHRRHPLRPLLAELDRLRTVQRIEVPRFNRTEVRSQMAGILAAEPEQSLVDDIFERSDGNAFFVEELAVAVHEGCRQGLTDSLRDLLLVRVEALPERAQQVVRVVAEGGSAVEYALLAAVTRLGEDDLIETLRSAVGAHILLATTDGDGYRFRHSLVREAVSDDLLPGERSRLRRRYAEALEADPGLVGADQWAARLASHWYHAHDAAKALPAVLRASVEARRRHAYAEQLGLLERAMELWDGVADGIRATLRTADYAEVYPSCGAGLPGDSPLSYLDLMAEASIAGRLCGQRERALKITKRALRLLTEESAGGAAGAATASYGDTQGAQPAHGGDQRDPLRAAWFWVQRSRLTQSVARGDGWEELSRAQELVRGLPPSEVHAEVLASVAAWSMLHEPGPETLASAERAVEYARMVGAQETELTARLTLGGLLVDCGDVEAGLAAMREVKDRALQLGLPAHIGRSFVNLPSHLEGVGRSAEAARMLEEGIALCRRFGLLFSEAFIRGNLAESLCSLGRWDEAVEAADQAHRTAQNAKPSGAAATHRAVIAIGRGDTDTAERELAASKDHFGTHDPMPQYSLTLTWIALRLAATQGRVLDARAELDLATGAGFPPGTQRYAWPLLLAAATAEADARGLPAAGPGRADALDRIRELAKGLPVLVPVWHAHELWVRAEVLRAEDRDSLADWTAAHDAFVPLERPYDLARLQHRLAEAALTRPAGPADGQHTGASGPPVDRERALELLRSARDTAHRLGARPLAEDIDLLARRARLSLTDTPEAPAVPDAPADPAEALGLTSRERDVLRLVAAGRSNRLIAQELFISPKTASVHVSNILAKLGVSGRGEAAALAHRLRLFPA